MMLKECQKPSKKIMDDNDILEDKNFDHQADTDTESDQFNQFYLSYV